MECPERMNEKYRIELLWIKIAEAMVTALSAQQWHILKPLIPTSKLVGRPRIVEMRYILNAIFYILQWLCLAIDDPRPAALVKGLSLFPVAT